MSLLESVGDLFAFVGSLADELGTILGGDEDGDESQLEDGIVRPLVLAGPSGAGKNALINKLMAEHPQYFGYSVAHTTRPPRVGEQHGREYFFTSTEVMVSMIDSGEFLETAQVHRNIYGTSKSAVMEVVKEGKICVLDIDTLGVSNIAKAGLDPAPIFVFIKPEIESLTQRLRDRQAETEESLQKKVQNAVGEISFAEENEELFDHIIENKDMDKCYDALKAILEPTIRAAAKAQAEASAPQPAPEPVKELEMKDMSTKTEPATEPLSPSSIKDPKEQLQALIRQKETELESANAAKNRNLAKTLISEIEVLEAQLS